MATVMRALQGYTGLLHGSFYPCERDSQSSCQFRWFQESRTRFQPSKPTHLGCRPPVALAAVAADVPSAPEDKYLARTPDPERVINAAVAVENWIEKRIFDCRFLTFMAVIGSLVGAAICFAKGSIFVLEATESFLHSIWQGMATEKSILLLVEAIDVYLIGTVMLLLGMGLHELFISIDEEEEDGETKFNGSNFFGMFQLKSRPKWLRIHSLDEMKTKLGHVIVMILLVGMFDKSKKVVVTTTMDLLFFSLSVFFASGCLLLLSKLHEKPQG